jgi:hypothetical protein
MNDQLNSIIIVVSMIALNTSLTIPADAAITEQRIHGYISIDSASPTVDAATGHESGSEGSPNMPLEGGVLYEDSNRDFCNSMRRLTESALQRSPEYQKAEKAVDHYSTKVQRSIRFSKDALNYAIPYRGCSMSIEGSQMVLNKKMKLTNLCIAELTKQRISDELQPKITARVMQIAMGLGLNDPEQSKELVDHGMSELTDMVGKEEANRVLSLLNNWKNQLDIPDSVYQQPIWDISACDYLMSEVSKRATDHDPTVASMSGKVGKLNHGKLFNTVSSIVEAPLAVTTLLAINPAVSIGAEAVGTAFVMAIGGPEENKLLKELYMARRMEIRRKKISDELTLALIGYQTGMLTHNGLLLASSEAVLQGLVGQAGITKILGHQPLLDVKTPEPIELAK